MTAVDPLAGFPGILDCVHCGLCLDACPTYKVTGDETDSPRGRILLLRAAAEGRVAAADIEDSLERCVLCRACEPVCPSRVPYHQLVEQHREGRTPAVLQFALRRILPSRPALRLLGLALRGSRALGLLGLVERAGTRRMRALAGAVPAAPSRFVPEAGRRWPARGRQRGRVGLHLGCVNAELFGAVLRDTIEVLAAQGFEVVVPAQPACCGALHAHSGAAAQGAGLAAATAQAFASGDFDAVLVPAAGCLAHLHERAPGSGFRDPLLWIAQAGLRTPRGRVAARVAHDPPCHLQNVVGGADAVTELLARIPGIEMVAHGEAGLCCGAGGVAFARRPEMSDPILARKLGNLGAAGPDVVASGNPGCLLRLEAGLRRSGAATEARHPVELLARACRAGVEDDA